MQDSCSFLEHLNNCQAENDCLLGLGLAENEAAAVMGLCRLDPLPHVPVIPSSSVTVISEQATLKYHGVKKNKTTDPVPENMRRADVLCAVRTFKDARVVSVNSCLLISIMDVYGPRLMEQAGQSTSFQFKHDRKEELVEALCRRSIELAMPGKEHIVMEELAKIKKYFNNR
jgi:hypothetical protein